MADHEAPDTHDLGKVIRDPALRRWIYTTYTVLLVISGTLSAGILATGVPVPPVLIGLTSALTFLGAPVGTLAAANVKVQ